VNFLAPANGAVLNAKARAVRAGSTIGVAQVDLSTNVDGTEKMCAVALATLRVVEIKSAVNSGS
jgi:acyl-coenzyme A thioesterase PaaI-like protein